MRRLAIWLTLATIATALLTLFVAPKTPVVAAELVKDAAAILRVYGGSSEFRSKLQANTICDFFFIASYGAMFFTIGRIARGKIGLVISAGAAIAALADVAENIGILRTVHAEIPTDALAMATRGPSLVKWALLVLVCALTGLFWMNVRGKILQLVDGLLYVGAAAGIAWGVFFRPENMMIAWKILAGAILLQLVVLIREKSLDATKS